uniref:Translation elongation factor EF1B beta/delta subunit guanine nucleotide exchange domain-containing protein n=2 Tax=Canis lupus familiaris TaxID=9615 RepID=A0A8C0MGP1_CANLF
PAVNKFAFSILLDVKPWDDETDMAQLEACVRSTQLDGLAWGAPRWCRWAMASASCGSSVWWTTTRWGQTCWRRRRSPGLRSMCRVWTWLLSRRSEPQPWPWVCEAP